MFSMAFLAIKKDKLIWTGTLEDLKLSSSRLLTKKVPKARPGVHQVVVSGVLIVKISKLRGIRRVKRFVLKGKRQTICASE